MNAKLTINMAWYDLSEKIYWQLIPCKLLNSYSMYDVPMVLYCPCNNIMLPKTHNIIISMIILFILTETQLERVLLISCGLIHFLYV